MQCEEAFVVFSSSLHRGLNSKAHEDRWEDGVNGQGIRREIWSGARRAMSDILSLLNKFQELSLAVLPQLSEVA